MIEKYYIGLVCSGKNVMFKEVKVVNRMKQKCKHQTNDGWCKERGGICIWSEYTPESCLKREKV